MVVAIESYQADATLTASSVATKLADALEDGGYGTPFDTFSSGGIENRIFKVTYDNTKTYGSTYYWFQCTASGIWVQAVSGWNATTHVPTGTQYLDYFSTATNTTANHLQLMALNSSVTFTIRRYTSGVDSTFSWFVMSCGTTLANFHISKVAPLSALYNLNKVFYNSMMWCQTVADQMAASVRFRLFPLIARRSWIGGAFMRGITSSSWYGGGWNAEPYNGEGGVRAVLMGPTYHFPGNYNNQGGNASFNESGIVLPVYFTNTNDSYTSDETPVCHSQLLTYYSNAAMPADIGLAANYNANTMAYLDTFEFTVGGTDQVWEILRVSNSAQAPPGTASPMFLARTL